MGIVVTIFMFLGLLMVSPLTWLSLGAKRQNKAIANFIGFGLLLAGIWNAFWHGLRFLQDFWGLAALASGVFMIVIAIIILNCYASSQVANHPVVTSIYKVIKPLCYVWLVGLLASFLLYSITLIRLNLGLPII